MYIYIYTHEGTGKKTQINTNEKAQMIVFEPGRRNQVYTKKKMQACIGKGREKTLINARKRHRSSRTKRHI